MTEKLSGCIRQIQDCKMRLSEALGDVGQTIVDVTATKSDIPGGLVSDS